MSSSRNCPFCQSVLQYTEGCVDRKGRIHSNCDYYFCDNANCINDDMPRYSIGYSRPTDQDPTKAMFCYFMIASYYVEIEWLDNETKLSTLEGAFLKDCITLTRAIDFDMEDLISVENRVKTLLLFS